MSFNDEISIILYERTVLKGEIALKSAWKEVKCQQISCLKEPPGQPQPRYRVCAFN